jgi:dienelactone hydrolase
MRDPGRPVREQAPDAYIRQRSADIDADGGTRHRDAAEALLSPLGVETMTYRYDAAIAKDATARMIAFFNSYR